MEEPRDSQRDPEDDDGLESLQRIVRQHGMRRILLAILAEHPDRALSLEEVERELDRREVKRPSADGYLPHHLELLSKAGLAMPENGDYRVAPDA